MIEEKKKAAEDAELDKMAAAFRLATSRVDELADAGVKASKKSYYLGRQEIYKRMLSNLGRVEEGIDSFFMGSLWNDVKDKEELLERSLRPEAKSKASEPDPGEAIESQYNLTFLKKRARAESEDADELRKIELLPGGSLKPMKKTL